MAEYTKKQGNSLFVNIQIPNFADIDPDWANWSGTFAVVSTLGAAPLLTGALTKSATAGTFYLRIGPVSGGDAWKYLPVAKYKLLTEIICPSVDFLLEDEDKLIITAQGMVS